MRNWIGVDFCQGVGGKSCTSIFLLEETFFALADGIVSGGFEKKSPERAILITSAVIPGNGYVSWYGVIGYKNV